MDTIGFDAIEYCWSELKRLGKLHGVTREREWDELMSACKRARYDSDGDVIMESIDEYVECPAVPEPECGPAEPDVDCGELISSLKSNSNGEPETELSSVGLVFGDPVKIEVEPEIDVSLVGLVNECDYGTGQNGR